MDPNSQKVIIIEDNEWYLKLLKHTVGLNPDFEVLFYTTGNEALQAIALETPAIVTMDYRLPDITGEELLQKIQQVSPQSQIIVISEQEDIETAINLIKLGAFDYLVKGNDIRDRLLNTLNLAQNKTQLLNRIARLEAEVERKFHFEETIKGNSASIKRLFPLLQKAADSSITVSVTGETGTGKEVVAKAIHYNSVNKDKPFVAINVAAIPKELFESELFGHEKGAFTGANQIRIGKFEEADGGTLFLDEIGELDGVFQAKLLRALQEREIVRVGSNKVIPFSCRIIVATHKNLLNEVKAGNFREDLYYRLIGLPIELPPLRNRDKDVILLAVTFISNYCLENNIPEKKLDASAQAKLLSYHWPGNIRELKSVAELSIVLSSSPTISADDILLHQSDLVSDLIGEEQSLREYNKRIVQLYLERYDNNTKVVAEKLDIGQTTIYRMLKE